MGPQISTEKKLNNLISEVSRLKGGASRSLIFHLLDTCLLTPLIPKAFGTDLARHETGHPAT
jgi:hypothetical protein